jgi:hypothetical protein
LLADPGGGGLVEQAFQLGGSARGLGGDGEQAGTLGAVEWR